MFKRRFSSAVYQYASLPLWKLSVCVVVAITIFFSLQNIQVINALVEGKAEAVNLDPTLLSSNPVETVRDALLSAPYQASVIFLPLVIALVYATSYASGEETLVQLLLPSWKIRLARLVVSSLFLSMLVMVLLSLVNGSLLYLFLDSSLKRFLDSLLLLDVLGRTLCFTLVMTLIALLCVILSKRSLPSLIAVLLLLILTLSGVLRALFPGLENILPLIGAKSFAFGRVEGNQPSQVYGFLLLLTEAIGSVFLLVVIEKVRNRRKR